MFSRFSKERYSQHIIQVKIAYTSDGEGRINTRTYALSDDQWDTKTVEYGSINYVKEKTENFGSSFEYRYSTIKELTGLEKFFYVLRKGISK